MTLIISYFKPRAKDIEYWKNITLNPEIECILINDNDSVTLEDDFFPGCKVINNEKNIGHYQTIRKASQEVKTKFVKVANLDDRINVKNYIEASSLLSFIKDETLIKTDYYIHTCGYNWKNSCELKTFPLKNWFVIYPTKYLKMLPETKIQNLGEDQFISLWIASQTDNKIQQLKTPFYIYYPKIGISSLKRNSTQEDIKWFKDNIKIFGDEMKEKFDYQLSAKELKYPEKQLIKARKNSLNPFKKNN